MAIAISEMPITADAFIEPFVSHLLAKKMMLKQGLVPQPHPQAQASFFYGGHYQQQPRPTPAYPVYGPPQPPSPTYPPYGPQVTSGYQSYGQQPTSSYPSYGPPSNSGYEAQLLFVKPAPQQLTPGYPSYGPPSNSGYESQPIAKPVSPLPPGCLPGTNYPSQSTDYTNYVVHGGHGFGAYGNNGNNGNAGTYGK